VSGEGDAARPAGQVTGWFIDELDFAGRENRDPRHVARYDDKEDSGAPEELTLLVTEGLNSDSVVLEFGPGTGQFALDAAQTCKRVIAVDPSPAMLARLEEKLHARGLDNVELVRAGFLSYEHAGEPADFVYSRLALHHIPDFWKALALRRMRDALRPGGIVRLWDVVYDFEPQEAEERIEAWCATGGETAAAEWTRAELEEHVRDEHSTFTWLLEPMIERCGFEIAAVERSDDGIFAGYLLRAV
jgi:SAM-dependent methyltransferase